MFGCFTRYRSHYIIKSKECPHHNNEEEKKTHTPPRVPLCVRFLPRRAFLEQLKLKRFQQRVVVACARFGLALIIGIHRKEVSRT